MSKSGHQRRTSSNSLVSGPAPGTYTAFEGAWTAGGSEQVRSDSVRFYGRFITTNAYHDDWNNNPSGRNFLLWHPYRSPTNDPCGQISGANWRMPTQTEWGDIFKGGQANDADGHATANTWVWRHPGTYTSGASGTAAGYEIKPDGTTTTLFLPSAGSRSTSSGKLNRPGINGYYWSSITYGTFAFYLLVNQGAVRPAYMSTRGTGLSVRCVMGL